MAGTRSLEHGLLEVAFVECAGDPLVVEDPLCLPVEHVSKADELGHLLSLRRLLLARENFIVTIKLVNCVLILVLAIFGDLE